MKLHDIWRALPNSVRQAIRRVAKEFWRLRRLPIAPLFETWVAVLDTSNRRYHRQVVAERTAGHAAALELSRPQPVPRILWLHWAQGLESAPPVVQFCMESWRRHNPNWDIRIIDAEAAAALVPLDDVSPSLPHRYRANALRLRLLRTHGGIWADATTWCHRPLDEWLPLVGASGFFVFSPAGPSRQLDNWFIASMPEHPLVSAWDDEYSRRIAGMHTPHPAYFIHVYALQWRLLFDVRARKAWHRMARLPAPPCFLLASVLEGTSQVDDAVAAVASGLPVSKLSWRMKGDPEELGLAIDSIEAAGLRSVPLSPRPIPTTIYGQDP